MEINIPGPTNPAYFAKIRFSLVKRSPRLPEAARGRRVVLATDVAVDNDPRGRPVWKTLVMLTWRGDMVHD